MKKILLIVIAVLMLGSIILAGCTPAPAPAPEPPKPTEPEWTPPIPGMKKGEEDLRFDWKFNFPAPRDKPPAGYELNKREWFFEEMKKRTDGRLNVEIVWGGQLANVKEATKALGAGVFESGMVPKEMWPDLFPYAVITAMPFWGTGDLAMDAELQRYVWTHPLAVKNFVKQGLKFGFTTGPIPFYVVISKKIGKVTDVNQLNGLQYRSFGYTGTWAKELGMVPNSLRPFEVYEAMEKGQVEVTAHDYPQTFAMKLYEQCDSIIDMPIYVSGGRGQGTVNLASWASLPQYMKDMWVEVEKDAQAYAVGLNGADIAAARKGLADNGVEIYKLAPEQATKLKAAGLAAWEQWVSVAEKGPNGKNVKKYITDCIAFRDKLTGEPFTVYKP